jgi:hypothetical protein
MDHQLLDDGQRETGIGPISTLAARASNSTGGFSWGGDRTKYSNDTLGESRRGLDRPQVMS